MDTPKQSISKSKTETHQTSSGMPLSEKRAEVARFLNEAVSRAQELGLVTFRPAREYPTVLLMSFRGFAVEDGQVKYVGMPVGTPDPSVPTPAPGGLPS